MTASNGHSGHDKCGGRTRAGGSCQRPAGWGTDHVGIGRCKLHGGSTPTHQVAAHRELVRQAEDEALRELAVLGLPPPMDNPLLVLAELAAETRQWQLILRGRVAELDSLAVVTDSGAERIRAVILAFERATAQAAELAETLARLNVDARLTAISRAQGMTVFRAFQRGLSMLELSEHQWALAREAMPKVLRALTADVG